MSVQRDLLNTLKMLAEWSDEVLYVNGEKEETDIYNNIIRKNKIKDIKEVNKEDLYNVLKNISETAWNNYEDNARELGWIK